MRERDLEKLEFNKVKEILLGFAHSYATEEKIRNLKPYTDRRTIEEEIELAQAFFKIGEDVPIYEFDDIRAFLNKAKLQGAILSVEDILKILNVIGLVKELRRVVGANIQKLPPLRRIHKKLHLFSPLENLINASIDPRGFVKDEASDELLRVRRTIRTIEEEIRKRLESLINRPDSGKFLADRIITIRNGRYVIPVKTSHVKKIFGIAHGTSSSGYTTYIEPQFVIHLNNKLTQLKEQEEEEVRRVLQRISEYIGDYSKDLLESFEACVEVDFLQCKYRFKKLVNGKFPRFGDGIELHEVKHPILMQVKEEVVPVDIILKEKKGLILTGPNTGGKTVALKTLGLSVLLFQSAIPIPANENSELPLFEKVFTDIGDEQSIEQSLSTFSAHMRNVAEFIEISDNNTLVLIDELGAGTDPIEGSAIGIGILEYLKEKNAWVFITTHHTPIKLYATTSDYYVPASVLFDRETLSPLYKITYNTVGESMAFYIAKRYGIPEKVIEIAKKHIGEFGEKYLQAMEELSKYIQKYEEEHRKVEELRKELEKQKEDLEKLKREYEEAKRKGWKEAYREAREYLRKLAHESEEILKKVKDKKEVKEFISRKKQELEKILPKERSDIKVGDTVVFMGKKGKVLEIREKKAYILLDRLKMWVDIKELEKTSESLHTETPKISIETPVKVERDTLNLVGKDVDTATLELERFIEEAYSVGLKVVRIIHGIGSGKLKTAVKEVLSKNEKVKFFRDAYPREGGSGVTVVYLNYGEER
ncbi:MAG TPA: endonuclease MutS2 [Aquifex aeolicus]|nr:endonuclease MutS2 [Aquifex aeolicus]